MEVNIEYHVQDEAVRLLKEIEFMKKNVDNSKLYAQMRNDLEKNETFQQHLFRILGSHSHVQLVIYALGSMEYCFNAQLQLALVLLLKRDFSNWIGDIQVYDPVMSLADIIVFTELGLEALTINEHCKRRVERPTMFFMPNPNFDLIGNLLGANWCSTCINQMILLTNSFRQSSTTIGRRKSLEEAEQRIKKILDFTTMLEIRTDFTPGFTGLAWHFFDMNPEIDMETSLPVAAITEHEGNGDRVRSWLEMQRDHENFFLEDTQGDLTGHELATIYGEYRGPRRLRCNPIPPPQGWIKLNIYGIGTKGDQPGRYSGVFQDEIGMRFGRYRGTIHVEDNMIAGLEALRHGLIRCTEGNPNAQKLVVESDDVMLVQYVNERPEPNETTMHRLREIFDLRERIYCLVYHVYEEANEAAKDWALKDDA